MLASISSDITSHIIDHDVVLFSSVQQQLFHLNSAAALIWLCHEDGLDKASISREVSDTFDISIERAEQDLDSMFTAWEKQGLLTSSSTDTIPVQRIPRNELPEPLLSQASVRPVKALDCAIEHGYTLLNSDFVIRCNDIEIEAVIRSVVGHLETSLLPETGIVLDIQRDEIGYSLFRDGELSTQCDKKTRLGSLIHTQILSETYNNVNFLIAIHAAAISNGDKCIVLPAGSGSGKSTLTAALVQSGYQYCTDELVFLKRRTHSIQAATAGIAIKSGSWPILKKYYPTIDDVPTYVRQDKKKVRYLIPSAEILPENLSREHQVSSLVFPTYKPEQPTSLTAISPADALCRLATAGYDMTGGLDNERVSELIKWIRDLDCYELHTQNLPDAISAIKNILP